MTDPGVCRFEGERIARVEERLAAHLETCDHARVQNAHEHETIKSMVLEVRSRLWWVMGLIIAGVLAILVEALVVHYGIG